MDFSKMKVRELKQLCKENKIKGYSKLKKKELVNKLQNLKSEEGPAPTKPMSPLLKRIKRKLK
tara:strand:- start:174 stop:362 length:189 start_codon:yes stop_codon:yes gene_type:complete